MWIARELAKKNENSAVVGASMRDSNVVGEYSDATLPFLAPYGIQSVPVNDKSLMLLDSGNGRVCAGVVEYPDKAMAGQVKIFSAGGAYISLDLQGNVIINGVKITKDGQILKKGGLLK